MTFVVSSLPFQGGILEGKFYIKGCYSKEFGKIFIKIGEILDYETDEEIFKMVTKNGIRSATKMRGEFAIIYCDCTSNEIFVCNDRLGRETLFYFSDGQRFILSDDFWEIVNITEPTAEDIDVQSVKEFCVFFSPFFYKTIVKNLNFFPPASLGRFSAAYGKFEITQYWDFKLNTEPNLSLEEAVECFDKALDVAFKQIVARNGLDVKYGVGVSGGLDSRLIPYYALKNGMQLKSFIIGEKRPHGFLLSRDHKNAREIAEYYELEHTEVPYDSEDFRLKSEYDLRYYPMGPSQFFISVRKEVPEFDVLLTGASGILVGSGIPRNIMGIDKNNLLDLILHHRSRRPALNKLAYAKIFIRFITGYGTPSFNETNLKPIDGIITEREISIAKEKIRTFVNENYDKSNLEIFSKFDNFNLGAKNKNGAFESLQGFKKSYSMYPFVLEELLKWKPEFFIGRPLLKDVA